MINQNQVRCQILLVPYVRLFAALSIWSVVLNHQTHAQSDSILGTLETPDNPISIEQTYSVSTTEGIDSLQLHLQELRIEEAQLQLKQTDFWHRLLPQVHLSASIGMRDILFIDPSYNILSVLPKDAYRITFTLSLSDLFDFSKHQVAELKLMGLRADFERLRQQQQASQKKLQRELSGLESLNVLTSDELRMKEGVLKFDDLRFQQGKIQYDALIRSKLDVLNMKKTIYHLNQQINEIRFKLHDGGQQ